MKKAITLFILCISCIVGIHAKDDNRMLITQLRDKVTNAVLGAINYGDNLRLVVCSEKGDSIHNGECDWFDLEHIVIPIPKEGGKFSLEIFVEGYMPYAETIEVKPFKSSEAYRNINNIRLTKKPKVYTLDGATVKASKVKFYYKGDTLVYNADAFETAEGSMLDELIRQLPGVEIKDGGLIFVNGKMVDALLLNGERIFNNNEVLLENLPNYMVKDIQVYDKESLDSKFAGQNMGNNEYVMDVKLKRQYCKGMIGNAEVGYGSSDRYLARLFGLRFTDNSRLSFFFNANNLNDNRKPGETDQWTPQQMPKGLVATRKGGLDYLVKHRLEKWKIEGGIEGTTSSTDNYQSTTSETFLPSGSLFTKAMASQKSSYRALNLYNTMTLQALNGYFMIKPLVYLSRTKSNGYGAHATFNANPLDLCSKGLLDSIRQVDGNNLLLRHAINRVLTEKKAENWQSNLSLELASGVTMGGNYFFWQFNIDNSNAGAKLFDQTLYDYPAGTKESDFRNKYTHDRPNRNFNIKNELSYSIGITTDSKISLSYDFKRHEETRDNELNLLNRLEDWNTMGAHQLGALPSETDFRLSTMDAENSYQKHEISTDNVFGITYSRWPHKLAHDVNIKASAQFNFMHDRLNYYRGNGFDKTIYAGVTRKNFVLQSYDLRVDLPKGEKKKSHPIFNLSIKQNAPSMLSLLDEFSNTADPLNIFTGNKNLKVSTEYNTNLEWRYYVRDKHNTIVSVTPMWIYTQNMVAYGSTYDINTGIRKYQPQNVNGNHRWSLTANLNTLLGKTNKWDFRFNTYTSRLHGVDLVSTTGAPTRNIVYTFNNKETIELKRSIGKHNVGFKGTFGVSNSSSKQNLFDSFTLYDFNYGLTGSIKLPWAMRLTTDLTMYSRRGYADHSANTNDLVWNARLSKTFTKAGVTFMLDGFDILNQLSNITQTVNSQGRTETYYNALPRYVMAHIIYRLNKQPRKK